MMTSTTVEAPARLHSETAHDEQADDGQRDGVDVHPRQGPVAQLAAKRCHALAIEQHQGVGVTQVVDGHAGITARVVAHHGAGLHHALHHRQLLQQLGGGACARALDVGATQHGHGQGGLGIIFIFFLFLVFIGFKQINL